MSQRHINSPRATPTDTYLDVAGRCIVDLGWKRTTLTEIARRAGVSRMTIYRAWPDMTSLLGDLLTREWARLIADLAPAPPFAADGGPSASQIAEGVGRVVTTLRDHELFVRLVELDPELLLPYLVARRGRSQDEIADRLAANIHAAQQAGTVREGDALVMARALILAAHGFVLSALTMTDDRVALSALDAELRTLVERSLAP